MTTNHAPSKILKPEESKTPENVTHTLNYLFTPPCAAPSFFVPFCAPCTLLYALLGPLLID